MFVSIVISGHQLNSLNPMWNQANRTQISTSMGSVSIVTKKTRKGHFWSYDNSKAFYGPFKNLTILLDDASTYSEHGTTNDALIKC